MSDGLTLLPSNATPLERAVALSIAPLSDLVLPTQQISYAEDDLPEEFLPWVAWGRSMDLWDERWPAWKKRKAIRMFYKLHALKGTLEGIRLALSLLDVEIEKVWRPRNAFRVGKSATEEETRAWLNTHPQLRIYRKRNREKLHPHAFIVGRSKLAHTGEGDIPRNYLHKDEAEFYYRPRAFLYDRGVETELTALLLDPVYEKTTTMQRYMVRKREPLRGLILGHRKGRIGQAFLHKDNASDRLYTMTTFGEGDRLRTVKVARQLAIPGLRQADVRAEVVAERFPLGRPMLILNHRSWLGTKRATLRRDLAIHHMFERIYLLDPSRPPLPRATGGSTLNRDIIGIPAHTALMVLKIRQPLKRTMFRCGGRLGTFLHRTDTRPYYHALEAVRVSKRFSDRILVDTTTVQTVKLGRNRKLGSFKLGALEEIF